MGEKDKMGEETLRKAAQGGTASRYRQRVATVFDCVVEVAGPGDAGSWVLWKYPEDFDDTGKLKAISEFAYPDGRIGGAGSEAVQMFTFVLTGTCSDYTFGYCRHTPRTNTCLVLLSGLPWTNFFYKLLNHFATIMNNGTSEELESLLVRGYHQDIPAPGESFVVESSLGKNKVECTAPDDNKLPTLQDNKYLQDYYGCVADHNKNINMIAVFVSLLQERRVIITGERIGPVSHCVLAAERLIYPLFWQYPFIPVLTKYEFLHCPTPFLAGVPKSIFEKAMREVDTSELVILDIDTKTFTSPFPDLAKFPSDVMRKLKHNLRHTNHLLGDGLARSFLRALAELLGGYRAGLHRPIETGGLSFDYDRFLTAYDRRPQMKTYLGAIRGSQVVQQFFDERVARLNAGLTLEDAFEEERRNLADVFPSASSARDYVRDKGLEAFSGFQERVKTLAKEGAAMRPGPPKTPSMPRMDVMASMVQEKLNRIPSMGGGVQKLEEQPDINESGAPSGLDSFDEIHSPSSGSSTPSKPAEANLLDLDGEMPASASISSHLGDLDPIHSSRSMSDLLALEMPAPAPATASPPLLRGPVFTAPSLHGSSSQGANLNRLPSNAAAVGVQKGTRPSVPSPLANSSRDQKPPLKKADLLIDWASDNQSDLLAAEFDPLVTGTRIDPQPSAMQTSFGSPHPRPMLMVGGSTIGGGRMQTPQAFIPNSSMPMIRHPNVQPSILDPRNPAPGPTINWQTFE